MRDIERDGYICDDEREREKRQGWIVDFDIRT